MRERAIEFWVGIFVILASFAILVLAFKVSGFSNEIDNSSYNIVATFDNIGGLKMRAPIKVAGVKVGQVTEINLDPSTYRARVKLSIEDKQHLKFSTDTTARILTAGLLGANYIELTPGFEKVYLKDGQDLGSTNSAVILEDLIGQFLFKLNK